MDHMFMLSGEIVSEPKIYPSQYGPSCGFTLKGDKISGIQLPNGMTEMEPGINGKLKLKDDNIPFYCQKGKRVVICGSFSSDAKQDTDDFKNLYVDFKQVNVVNTPSVVNFAYGTGEIRLAQKGKTGVLYTIKEKKKPVGASARDTAASYRYYRVYSNDLNHVLSVGDNLIFQGIVLRGIFPLPADYEKYGPLTQPVFYADSISGYVKSAKKP